MDVKRVLARVKELHSSMTAYLCVQLLRAIAGVLPVRELRKPVTLTVPVRLEIPPEVIRREYWFAMDNPISLIGKGKIRIKDRCSKADIRFIL